jgi:predicted house-cleaning noncanonical NTP pyrophosphatase (MazG superfamily)
MSTVLTTDPQFQSAIQACAIALHKMADYELEPSLQRRLHELGERKEFLSSTEHEELLALVDFVHKRTIEKLEAQTALARLRTAVPGIVPDL